MSLELVIIPLALAAISAAVAARASSDGPQSVVVTTRMRNRHLLEQSLTQTGAIVSWSEDSMAARWPVGEATLRADSEGVWSACFSDDFEYETAVALIRDIDSTYAVLVQQEVLKRMRERAPLANMVIESETVEEDLSVTLVLNVLQGGEG